MLDFDGLTVNLLEQHHVSNSFNSLLMRFWRDTGLHASNMRQVSSAEIQSRCAVHEIRKVINIYKEKKGA